MKILYETPEGHLITTECDTVMAVRHVYDHDMWYVHYTLGRDGDTISRDLTEQEAKAIVRKLFDYGVYMRCP